MAARLIRIVLASLLALAILLVGGASLALLAFNPNAFKSALIGAVGQRYHRQLVLTGRLQLRLFPPFTLQTGPMRLSATDGHTPFAQAADMRLHLDPLALLRRRVVIDGIELDAPRLQLRRDAAGKWNFSDLLTAPTSAVPSLAIHSLSVHGGDIALSDATQGLDGRLSGVDAEASGIGLAGWHAVSLRARAVLSQPNADTQFNLRGQLHVDPGGTASLRNLLLRSDGSLLGGARMLANLHADLQWTPPPSRSLQVRNLQLRAQGRMHDGQPLQIQVTEPLLDWSDTWTRASVLQAQALIGAAPATLRVRLRGGPVNGPGADLVVSALRLDVERAAPRPLDLRLRLGAHLNLPAGSAIIDTLDGHGAWGLPARAWQARGQGSYGAGHGLELKLQGDFAGAPMRVDAQCDMKHWQLQAQAWGGALQARGAVPRGSRQATLHATLQHASLSPMLQTLFGAAAMDGNADLQADLAWNPTGGQAWYQGAGSLSAKVQGGHLLGVDLRGAPSAGEAAGAPVQALPSSAFTQLDAELDVTHGLARLRELQLRTAHGNWTGSGSVDLASRRLNLWLRPAPGAGHATQPADWLNIGGTPARPRFAWQASAPADAASAPGYKPK